MLTKLLKNDLKKNMRWLWILFVSTILVAGITRGFKELGTTIAFFKILGIIFDSLFYALAVNVVLQPFLRNFLNFTKSFYSDNSYLTHTLPVTKNQLINSKYITAITEIVLGFACLFISILIMYASPSLDDMLMMLLSTTVSGYVSLWLAVGLIFTLIIIEFLMYISIIFYSIVVSYRARERRVLKTFLTTVLMAFVAITILSIVMVVVLLTNGVDLSTTTLILPNTAFLGVLISGIVVYTLVSIFFYFMTKHEFNKGVDVD